MKRSRSIELALMGTVPLLLSGCDQLPEPEQQSALLYQDLQQCIADGKVTADVCQKGYEQALQARSAAPHYGSLAECEAEFGYAQCRPASSGSGNWFIPAAAGFLIARALDSSHDDSRLDYGWSGYGGWSGQPIYRSRGDRAEWRTGSGERFGSGARGPRGSSVAETLSRGGFGYSSAARVSWGG